MDVKYPLVFRSDVQILRNLNNLSNCQIDELFAIIYDCLKEDLSLFFKINSLSVAQNFFIAYAQAKRIDVLLKEMKKRLEYLSVDVCCDYSLFRDVIYYFLRIRAHTGYVYFSEKLSYVIVSDMYENEVKKEDLQRIFKLFDLKFEIYPFLATSEITFSHWGDIYHIHAYQPKAILCDKRNEIFDLFIYYLFLFVIFQKMRKKMNLYMINFMNFTDVYLEFSSSHSKLEDMLLALSRIYSFLRFFAKDSSDRFKMYKESQVVEIPSYLFPTKF